MILIQNYSLAIFFTILAMICWGSWANTQKIAAKTWRFELFYWDLIVGIAIMSLVTAFTVGSLGVQGRTFLEDLATADFSSIGFAMLGGILWNIGNILLVAAISVAGLAIAFPIGGGIAWILGIIINYILILLSGQEASEKPVTLWIGVVIIITAIVLSGKIYDKVAKEKKQASLKGVVLSVLAGLFIAFFYGFVVKSLDASFVAGGTGKLTPYTGIVFFTLGVIISTLIINPIIMHKPIIGDPVSMKLYWKGTIREHSSGVLGGMIWMLGMTFSFMAAGAANPAISYALSNAAPVVAILWGIFVWKEFKGAPKGTNSLLLILFICYLMGLVLITYSNA
ncbi:MAG: multidrug DMT transporter permease [Bacteroidetes bacterium]|nr:multidrug DMT transporter permease [Bacteroidota bacterium]